MNVLLALYIRENKLFSFCLRNIDDYETGTRYCSNMCIQIGLRGFMIEEKNIILSEINEGSDGQTPTDSCNCTHYLRRGYQIVIVKRFLHPALETFCHII
jgi:hypothetical protein